jgi:hypothetical protein
MDLVRVRPGAAEERLSLNGLLSEVVSNLWVTRAHQDPKDTRDFVPDDEVMKKPLVSLMRFADYDHDGQATEFVMTLPAYGAACGHYSEAVVLGISKAKPHLHPFGVKLPSERDWESLRTAKAGEAVQVFDLRCGDHGNSDQEQSRLLTWDSKGLHEVSKTQPCSAIDY